MVRLPASSTPLKVRVRLAPAGAGFDAELVSEKDGAAVLALRGALEADNVADLKLAVEKCHGLRRLTLDVADLKTLGQAALRYLAFYRQCAGGDFTLRLRGAKGAVEKAIRDSELAEALS
jgi:anti-anti-sigma regulatory factor